MVFEDFFVHEAVIIRVAIIKKHIKNFFIIIKKILCSSRRRVAPKWKHGRSLLQSNLMAHEWLRLALLYSYPDAVRGHSLHKTLISTRLTERNQPYGSPRGTFGLAIADCKYRAPLTPRLAQYIYFTRILSFWQGFLRYFS